MNLIKIQAISRKEYYHLIRDFRSLYLAFIIPLLLILLFGYALSLDVDNIRVVVVDHDQTDLSRDLIRSLDASSYFHVIGQVADDRMAGRYLDDGMASVAIILAPGWTADIRADRESPVQILIDGSDPNFAGITRSYLTAFMLRYNQKQLLDFLNRQGSGDDSSAGGRPNPRMVQRGPGKPQFHYSRHHRHHHHDCGRHAHFSGGCQRV